MRIWVRVCVFPVRVLVCVHVRNRERERERERESLVWAKPLKAIKTS